ncbi:Gfo/Idh/MocA family protein [Microlunatus antarcticus]|uniref:Putative dehydrogenase n=1 Tax=Microlunatus antarcticus TaxID=53388 RepID=A0A7W5JV98_9ACTN|nr:Gfo/Idh/MocA family oxidoreductase [Microlunatus antarcticus]MBB3326923.1 putative dehydrogenase [Microlunatus antarcticus]
MTTPTSTSAGSEPLRIGLLGASRIAVESLVVPAHDGGARLVAVAARDPRRAEQFAAEHGVERVVATYEDLLADPEVEVVYNALPNSLHAPWNLAAIAAGKHVLTEKPFASNAEEARTVADAAAASGLVVFDAFHHRYHPVFARLLEVVTGGELGTLRTVRVQMVMPPPPEDDLRWSLPLAGGVLMDLGCYALNVMSTVATALGGVAEPVAAHAVEGEGRPGVDARFEVEVALPGAVRGEILCAMSDPELDFSIMVTGDLGEAKINNFIKVSTDDRLVVRRHGEDERVEHLGTRSSYHHQLDALTAAVRTGAPFPTDAADGVVNLELIDACYRLAGLEPRPTSKG